MEAGGVGGLVLLRGRRMHCPVLSRGQVKVAVRVRIRVRHAVRAHAAPIGDAGFVWIETRRGRGEAPAGRGLRGRRRRLVRAAAARGGGEKGYDAQEPRVHHFGNTTVGENVSRVS